MYDEDFSPKPKVLRLFKELMKHSNDPVYIYRRTCKKLNYEVFSADKVSEWIENFRNCRPIPDGIDVKNYHHNVFWILINEFRIEQSYIAKLSTGSKRFLHSTNGRYMFEFKRSRGQIILLTFYDTFYGVETELYFASKTPVYTDGGEKLMYLGFGYYLLYNRKDRSFGETHEYSLYLLKIDMEHSICTVLDQKHFEEYSFEVVHDSTSYECFAVLTKNRALGNVFLRRGRLSGIKLKFDKYEYKFESSIEDLKVIRLLGNEVIAFTCESENLMGALGMNTRQQKLRFGKFDLSQTEPHIKRTEVHSFDGGSVFEDDMFWDIVIFCTGDLFYLVLHRTCLSIFVFNVNTCQLLSTTKKFLFGECKNIHINKSECLTALVLNRGKYLWFRLPLNNEPDSLGNLVMIALGQQAEKSNKPRAFKNLLSKFPLKFRAFSGI